MPKKNVNTVAKVYEIRMRNWLYNAGIVGFLRTLAHDDISSFNQLDKITNTYKDFVIYTNKIFFHSSVLDSFYDRYEKLIFCEYFDVKLLKNNINKLLSEKIIRYKDFFEEKKEKKKKKIEEKGFSIFMRDYAGIKFPDKYELSDPIPNSIREEIQKLSDELSNKTYNNNIDIYKVLKQKNSNYFSNFYENYLQRIILHPKNLINHLKCLEEGLKEITPDDHNQSTKSCFTCQKFEKKHDFNKVITRFEGINFHNSNWAWDFKIYNLQICDLCAFIYSCASLGLIHRHNNRKDFFYAVNDTSSIEKMYNSFYIFRMLNKSEKFTPFQNLVKIVENSKYTDTTSLNFIEITENNFGGMNGKNYNVNSFFIPENIANFLKVALKKVKTSVELNLGTVVTRSGTKVEYRNINEEVIKKTLAFSLDYSYLPAIIANYFEQIEKNEDKSSIRIGNVISYVIKFVMIVKKEQDMKSTNYLIKRAFDNGEMVRKKIDQDNKVKTLAYQLLNDLKICDINAFMDKYLRTIIAYNCDSLFFTAPSTSSSTIGESREKVFTPDYDLRRVLTDNDVFLAFGYAFLNGLLSKDRESTSDFDDTTENND